MPADTFKEVLYQKLQFPLYFEVKNIMKARVNESTISLALWILILFYRFSRTRVFC